MSEKAKIIAVECSDSPQVLAQFQNKLPENASDFRVHFAEKEGRGAKGPPLMVCSASASSIYSGQVQPNPLVDNFLVIRNKKTNRLRLVPYQTCSLINEFYTSLPLSVPTSEQDKLALRHSIAKYGGKNALRAQDRAIRMRVNIDVIKDQLDQTISMSTEQMKLEHQEEERLLDVQDERVEPPKNYEAKSVQELYDLRQILTPELVDELEDTAKEVLDTKPEDLPFTSDFLLEKFRNVQRSETLSQAEKVLQVCGVIYVDALHNLINGLTHRSQPLNRIATSQVSGAVEVFIRRNFLDPNSANGMTTKFTRRKAVCHYLAAALVLSPKLELATEQVIADLKMRKEELLDFARFMNLRTALSNSFLGLRMPKSKKEDDSRKIRRVVMKKNK